MTTPRIELHNRDCIPGMAELPGESIDLVVTSPPFEELFTYSGKLEDVGNNGSTADIRTGRFAMNMRYVAQQIARLLKPEANACIHIQQLLAYKCQHGFMGRRDFRGMVIETFRWAGLEHTGEFVIPKNPQRMAQALNLHSLQFKTGYARNSQILKPAPNDYVFVFSKPGSSPQPVRALKHEEKNPNGWVTQEDWIKWASGVWGDIMEIDVLDGVRRKGLKEEEHEKHVCPLQLSLIRRCIDLYTGPLHMGYDSVVLDPFMGIGSTAYVAVGGLCRGKVPERVYGQRHVIGFELKESYHRASLDYVKRALADADKSKTIEPAEVSLFDHIQEAETAGVA